MMMPGMSPTISPVSAGPVHADDALAVQPPSTPGPPIPLSGAINAASPMPHLSRAPLADSGAWQRFAAALDRTGHA